VLQAMNVAQLHHRSDIFKRELRRACEGMRWLLGWDSDPIFLACSGTGALEATLLNTCRPGDTIIAVNGGSFGARWGKIAERLGIAVHEIRVAWGSAVTVEQVHSALSACPQARAFCVQHSETSTTVLHPLEGILATVKQHAPHILTCVDGISACATTPLPGSPAQIDIYIAGSQKGLMCPPGLAVLALSEHAWEAVESTPRRTLYFDLAIERRALAGGETAWTPASTLIVGLNAALDLMRTEGLERIYRRHALASRMARAGLAALECQILAPDAPCPSVTGFFSPPTVDADQLRGLIRSTYGIRLAGGQGELTGKVIRIGHMGYIDPFEVQAAITAIGFCLLSCGAQVDVAAAVGATVAAGVS
jgi:aspartate aminotransferase-like enzyme